MKRLLALTFVLAVAAAWTTPATAQTTMRVTAKIDGQGMATLGRFQVPIGLVATDFKVELRATRPTTAFNDRPSVAITSGGGGMAFFTRRPTSDGLTNDSPVPLSQLVLQPGSYEVRPGGGRGSLVAVEFILSTPRAATPGRGEITAFRNENCDLEDATLTVPAGMKAINLHIWTHDSGLPCTPGTLPPPMQANLNGPGFAYQWSKDRATGTANEWPAPISSFELMPGIYTLRTGLGKLTRTKLSYELVPLEATGDVVNMSFPPALWEPVTEGTGNAWVEGNNLHVDSEGQGSGWFRTPRPYGFDNDYALELEFRVNTDNGHWVWIWSDGFIAVNTDWGLQFNHHQPGASYLTKVIATLEKDRWYQLRVDASPENKVFRVYLDGHLAGTATGIEPLSYHVHGSGYGNTDPDAIYFGDADKSGNYNHGKVSVRAIRVTGASAAAPADGPDPRLTSGTYNVTVTGNGPTWVGIFRITVNSGTITGSSEWKCCPGPRVDPIRGQINGDRVMLERDCTGQGYSGPCHQAYTGTLSGNQITGSWSHNGTDAGRWILQLP